MTNATRSAIQALCSVDSSIAPEALAQALDILDGKNTPSPAPAPTADSVLTREEVAKMLAICPHHVTVLARRGRIRKIGFGSGRRANGYSRKSVEALIAGGAECN